MKDRQIGTTFKYPDLGILKVAEEGAMNECYGCVFNRPTFCGNSGEKYITGECAAERRYDKKGVIFVKAGKEGE